MIALQQVVFKLLGDWTLQDRRQNLQGAFRKWNLNLKCFGAIPGFYKLRIQGIISHGG